jgi:sulfatase maturation enzyme AslB (radical SAM superfamily)
MLSLTTKDIEQLTKPLCSKEAYAKKIHNFNNVERSFKARSGHCEGMPIELNLEPSGMCNLHCPGCPRGRNRIKRTGFLSYRVFRDVFTQVGETLCNVFISGFGEPLMNDELPRMIQLASQYSVSTLMNTNGTLLAKHAEALLDARLTLINIALDGIMTDSYHQYNPGAPFESVIKGVKQLCREKARRGLQYPVIEGQIIIREDTVKESNRIKTWAEGIGIEKVKFKRPYLSIPGDEERPVVESVSEYLKFIGPDNFTSTEKIEWSPADCTKPWDNLLLSCTGQIGICCYDPHLRLKLNKPNGPVNIAKLWNGDLIQNVRNWLSGDGLEAVNPCSRCNRMPGYLIPK